MTTEPKESTASTSKTTSTTLTPHLCCRNAVEAVEFYGNAFGAEPMAVHKAPNGQLLHAALSVDGATFFLTDEFPEQGGLSPLGLGGTPVVMHLQVADCDALFERAVDAGCQVIMPLAEMFWGDRYGLLVDPYGHKWSIATTVREVSPEELQRVVDTFPDCCTE